MADPNIPTEVDIVSLMKGVTLHVKIKRGTELAWRLWIAGILIRLAAWFMNCQLEWRDME